MIGVARSFTNAASRERVDVFAVAELGPKSGGPRKIA
jgi:hypothetical protein